MTECSGKYRLSRVSKNFGKVWATKVCEFIDVSPKSRDFVLGSSVPEITFDETRAGEWNEHMAPVIADDFNANLGPNSHRWQVEEAA